MLTDGLVFDVILILAVTHQTLFVGFFFLVHTDGSLCWKECGRSAYWSIEYIKEIPISTQKKKRFHSRGQQQRKFTGKKKPFLHKKNVQLLLDWFGTTDDMAPVLLFWNGRD